MNPAIKAVKRVIEQRQPRSFRIPGQVTSIGGSTSPANRPNWTYVRLSLFGDATVYPAFNNSALVVEGAWVEVEVSIDDEVYARIVGPYISTISPIETIDASRYAVPNHGANHQMPSESAPGPDPTLVFQPAIQMLKTTGDGASLIISVQPLIYGNSTAYRYFPGEYVNLTSYVPSTASRVLKVLVYLDKATNTIGILPGAEAVDNGVAPIQLPLVPSGSHGSAYVKLANGQTAISTATHITDIRRFLSESEDSAPGQATEIGDILISFDGLTFQPAIPLVNAHGEILTNDTGIVVA